MTILAVEPTTDDKAEVTARSGLTGETNKRVIPVTKQGLMRGLADHAAGALIQNVFPDLSTDDREFLMTGITPEEWDAAFGDEEDYEEEDYEEEEW